MHPNLEAPAPPSHALQDFDINQALPAFMINQELLEPQFSNQLASLKHVEDEGVTFPQDLDFELNPIIQLAEPAYILPYAPDYNTSMDEEIETIDHNSEATSALNYEVNNMQLSNCAVLPQAPEASNSTALWL